MPIKPGFKTSEFLVALIGAVIPVLNEQLGWKLSAESIISITLIVITFITSRTVVKRNNGTKSVVPPTP